MSSDDSTFNAVVVELNDLDADGLIRVLPVFARATPTLAKALVDTANGLLAIKLKDSLVAHMSDLDASNGRVVRTGNWLTVVGAVLAALQVYAAFTR